MKLNSEVQDQRKTEQWCIISIQNGNLQERNRAAKTRRQNKNIYSISTVYIKDTLSTNHDSHIR